MKRKIAGVVGSIFTITFFLGWSSLSDAQLLCDRYRPIEVFSSNKAVATATASNQAFEGMWSFEVFSLAARSQVIFISSSLRYVSPDDLIAPNLIPTLPPSERTVSVTTGQAGTRERVDVILDNASTLLEYIEAFNANAKQAQAFLVNRGTAKDPDFAIVVQSLYPGTPRGYVEVYIPAGVSSEGIFDDNLLTQATDLQVTNHRISKTFVRGANVVHDVIPGWTITFQDLGGVSIIAQRRVKRFGDYDIDFDIDGRDFSLLRACLARRLPLQRCLCAFDYNGDRRLTRVDIEYTSSQFTGPWRRLLSSDEAVAGVFGPVRGIPLTVLNVNQIATQGMISFGQGIFDSMAPLVPNIQGTLEDRLLSITIGLDSPIQLVIAPSTSITDLVVDFNSQSGENRAFLLNQGTSLSPDWSMVISTGEFGESEGHLSVSLGAALLESDVFQELRVSQGQDASMMVDGGDFQFFPNNYVFSAISNALVHARGTGTTILGPR